MRQYPPPLLDPDCDDLEAARLIGIWTTGLLDQLDAYLADSARTPTEFQAGIDELLRLVRLSAIVCQRLRTDQDAGLRDFLAERLAGWECAGNAR